MKTDEKDATGRNDTGAPTPVLVWFRSDLRLADNQALTAAISRGGPVVALFILDERSEGLRPLGGAQRWWLHGSLTALAASLRGLDIQLVLRRGAAPDVLRQIIEETGARTVLWNRRYEPAGAALDADIRAGLDEDGIEVQSFAGQLLHEPTKLLTGKGKSYKVYTPFWRTLDRGLEDMGGPPEPLPAPGKAALKARIVAGDDLASWNLLPAKPNWAETIAETWTPGEEGARERLEAFISGPFDRYATARDVPADPATSRLSPHLAFGEITPRQIWHASRRRTKGVPTDDRVTFRKELVWREFSYHLLFHFPHLARANHNRRFDAFPWTGGDDAFGAWCRGETGYPIVDAGMRELWRTGWMHNRVRLITASFLTKHLLIDWRRGEAWFWDTLVDADPASNAANWQWVAGSGADAAPYFRIFNPILQGAKFDPGGAYVRRHVPELAKLPDKYIHRPWDAPEGVLIRAGVALGETYPNPIVDHDKARRRALAAFAKTKDSA